MKFIFFILKFCPEMLYNGLSNIINMKPYMLISLSGFAKCVNKRISYDL